MLAKNGFFASLIGMRNLTLSLLFLLAVFAGSFLISQHLSQKPIETSPTPSLPSFALKKRPFTVVVVGYNNGASVEKTISSVLSQAYENFRLLYIDDASSDGSGEVARDCIDEHSWLSRVTFIKNEEHFGFLANVYRAALACPDDEILVLLRGEDWLAHEWALERLNIYYEDPNLWVGVALGIDYPTYSQTDSSLQSFYASLVKKVGEREFISGFMTPVSELAKDHLQRIPEVLFVQNLMLGKVCGD